MARLAFDFMVCKKPATATDSAVFSACQTFQKSVRTSIDNNHNSSHRTTHSSVNTTKTYQKSALAFALLLAILPISAPAHANIFDPLLKVLLPFYKSGTDTDTDSQDSSSTQTNTQTITTAVPVNTHAHDNTERQDNSQANDNVINLLAISPEEASGTVIDPTAVLAGSPDLFVLLQAEFAADRGDIATALKLYKAEAFKQNATAIFERALGLSLQYETPDVSLAFAKRWQQENPEHVPAWFYVAHLALRAEDYDTAAATLNQILSLEPNADLTQILTGIFPANSTAQRALFNALATTDSEQNVSLSVLKAGLLMQMNEPIAARLHIDNAIRLDPNNLAILTLKANILNGTGETERLTAFLNEARQSTTGNTQKELYLYEIRQFIDQGRLTDAWGLLQDASDKFADDHELVLLASLVALDTEHHTEANILLSQLLHDPAFASEAHYYLGISNERLQNHAAALAHYRQVDDVELVLDARKKIVAYELMAGNITAATDSLIELREHYPDFTSDSYILQADILLRQGGRVEAIALLEQAVQANGHDTQLIYSLTELLDDVADAPKKQALLTELLALDPSNSTYQLAQARLALANNPNDYSALTTATVLSQMSLDNPEYNRNVQLQSLQLLAQHALLHADFATAIHYLQTPYELEPNLASGIILLRAYQGLGDTDSVNHLLQDLQSRFGNSTSTETKPTSDDAPPSSDESPDPNSQTDDGTDSLINGDLNNNFNNDNNPSTPSANTPLTNATLPNAPVLDADLDKKLSQIAEEDFVGFEE